MGTYDCGLKKNLVKLYSSQHSLWSLCMLDLYIFSMKTGLCHIVSLTLTALYTHPEKFMFKVLVSKITGYVILRLYYYDTC